MFHFKLYYIGLFGILIINFKWLNLNWLNLFNSLSILHLLYFSLLKLNFFYCCLLFIQVDWHNVFVYKFPSVTLALCNALAFFHPILLIFFFYNFFYIQFCKKQIYVIFKKSNTKIFAKPLVVVCTFSLGSYWSAQELLWGGFWNWDFVEFILLLFVLFILLISHSNSQEYVQLENIQFKQIFLILTQLYGLINRLNLIFSQHSFTASIYSSFPKFYGLVYCLGYQCILFYWIWKSFTKKLLFWYVIIYLFLLYLILQFIQLEFQIGDLVINKTSFSEYTGLIISYLLIYVSMWWYCWSVLINLVGFVLIWFKVFQFTKKRFYYNHISMGVFIIFVWNFISTTTIYELPVNFFFEPHMNNCFFGSITQTVCQSFYYQFFYTILIQFHLIGNTQQLEFINQLENFNFFSGYILWLSCINIIIFICFSKISYFFKNKLIL